ncbi:MAG TPA: hypothetical protein VHA75_04305, partial [Rugosimonospora sp.]|nr:hypothetical protein [Rugosimonospora sp.]
AEEYEVKVTGTGGYTRTVRACAVELLPVDGLAAGSSYTVQARVRSDVGWSARVPVRVSTRGGGTAPVPPAPTGVTATVTGGVTTLAWNPVAGAEGYLVTQLDGGSRVSVALLTTASFVLGVEGEVATNVYVVAALTSGGLGPDSAAVTAPGTPTPRTVTVTPAQNAPDATGVIPYTESGAWLASSLVGADGEPTRYSNAVGAYATWSPRLAAAGTYQVEIWVPANSGTSTSVRYDIAYDGGTATLTVNQLAHSGVWYPLGAWPFAAGHAGTVRLTFTGGSGYARAGAVRFTPQ